MLFTRRGRVMRLATLFGAGALSAVAVVSCRDQAGSPGVTEAAGGSSPEAGGDNAVSAGAGGDESRGGVGGDGPVLGGAGSGAENGGAAGADGNPPDSCTEASDCDDGQACTHDFCDAVAGCVSINPVLDCRGWGGSTCAAEAILARGSGEQVTCVPPTTFAPGTSICSDQVCRGAPGCELTYRVENGTVTSAAEGYDFEGQVVAMSGHVTGASGALTCVFGVGLLAPEPFAVHYGLSRPGCSQVVEVDAAARATWSGVTIQASTPECAIVVSLLRSLLTTSQLNDYLKEPLENLTCAACAKDCPGGFACR